MADPDEKANPFEPWGAPALDRGRSAPGRWVGWAWIWGLQGVTAVAAASALSWTVYRIGWPVVRGVLEAWETPVECRGGQWLFPDDRVRVLAESRDVAVILDPALTGQWRTPVLVEIHMGRQAVRVYSPVGEWQWRHPGRWSFVADAETWRAASEAWLPFGLAVLGLGAAVSLWVAWRLLAVPYALWILLSALILRREVRGGRVWQMALLLQLPGAWVLTVAVLAYAVGAIDGLGLIVAFGLHWIVTGILLVASPFLLPRREGTRRGSDNPFCRVPDPENRSGP